MNVQNLRLMISRTFAFLSFPRWTLLYHVERTNGNRHLGMATKIGVPVGAQFFGQQYYILYYIILYYIILYIILL